MSIKNALLLSLAIHTGVLFTVLSFLPDLDREDNFLRISLINIKVEETKHKTVLKKTKVHRKKSKRKVRKIKKVKKEKLKKDILKPKETVMEPSEREVTDTVRKEKSTKRDLLQEEIGKGISKDQTPTVSKYVSESLDEGRSYQDKYREENLSAIREAILSYLRYPPVARRMGWEGTVRVRFTLTPEGKLEDLEVEESSGYRILDESALRAVLKASGSFPKPKREVTLVIPIVFKLE